LRESTRHEQLERRAVGELGVGLGWPSAGVEQLAPLFRLTGVLGRGALGAGARNRCAMMARFFSEAGPARSPQRAFLPLAQKARGRRSWRERGVRPSLVPHEVVPDAGTCRCSRRARRDAEIAAGAECGHDRVHELGRADDGVDGTSLDAQGAADAARLVDRRDAARAFHAVAGLSASFPDEQRRKLADAGFASGRHWLMSASPPRLLGVGLQLG